MVEKTLQTELFLELIFSVSGETDEQVILKKSIPFYLRKLNCFLAGVLKNTKNGRKEIMLVPYAAGKSEDWNKVKDHFNAVKPKTDGSSSYLSFVFKGFHYYAFELNEYGILILGRKKPFDRSFTNELKPVVVHLGNVLGLANEIEARKESDVALKATEQRFRALSDTTTAGILIYQNRCIVYANPAAIRFSGLHQYQNKPFDFTDFVHPSYKKWFSGNVKAILKNPKLTARNKIIITPKSQDEQWIDISMSMIDWDGNPAIIISAFNITKSKEVEDALKLREDRLSKIMLTANDGMWDWDLQTGKVFFDARYYSMAGYEVNEFPHHLDEFVKRVHPEDIDYVMGQAQKHLDGDLDRFVVEFRFQRKDGEWFWIMGKGVIVERDMKDQPLRLIGTHTDISDRKLVEENLRESEVKFRSLVESSSDWIWEVNEKGIYTYASPKVESIIGYKPDEVVGKSPFDFIAPWERDSIKSSFLQFVKHGEPIVAIVNTNIHKNGHSVVLETSGVAVRDADGRVCGYRGVDRNITERKLAEKSIKESEEKYRNLVERANDGICIVQDGIVKFANSPLARMWGGALDEIINLPFSNYIHPNEIERINDYYKRRLTGKEVPSMYETVLVKKNGSPLHAELNASITTFGGRQADLVFIRDITDRKQAEKILLAAKERAEESDRLKSAFLANMSHEIRTPMNAILGFTSLLKEPKLSGEEQQEFIKVIELSGHRMLNTINDLIDISKIEAGQVNVVFSSVDIKEPMEYLFKLFKPEVEKKGLRFSCICCQENQSVVVKTDREKIIAILTNLIKNAIKYSDRGSIEFGCQKKNDQLEFFVSDNGIGISKDRQEFIFERFVQADISDKRAYQGAGLGLSISKSFVEMLGGRIWVNSELGKGSVFYFSIPINNDYEDQNDTNEIGSFDRGVIMGKELKVLVVEDDPSSELFLTMILKKISKKINYVKTGLDAIDACRNSPDIDLVLMDIKLPEMNGYDATRKIREFNKDIIIIAQTAYGLSDDRKKALDAGCNDYISKPIDRDEFYKKINSFLKINPSELKN
ncbi:MAG: PAS domain S-box protein [Bacteroidales bacterium]